VQRASVRRTRARRAEAAPAQPGADIDQVAGGAQTAVRGQAVQHALHPGARHRAVQAHDALAAAQAPLALAISFTSIHVRHSEQLLHVPTSLLRFKCLGLCLRCALTSMDCITWYSALVRASSSLPPASLQPAIPNAHTPPTCSGCGQCTPELSSLRVPARTVACGATLQGERARATRQKHLSSAQRQALLAAALLQCACILVWPRTARLRHARLQTMEHAMTHTVCMSRLQEPCQTVQCIE